MNILFVAALLVADSLAAPDFSHPWTLQECTDWAMEHNLTVARQELAVGSSEVSLNSAQWAVAPSVNGSASQNWSFGRGLGGDNTYESGNTSNTGFSIGAGMTLFDGLATPRRIEMAKLDLDAALADLDKAREDVRVSVAQAYMQILYNYEIRDVAASQITIDSLQVVRLEGMVAHGKASAAELSQQRASLAQSGLTLVQAENNLKTSLLDLAQLLELSDWAGFDVVRPEVTVEDRYIGTPDDIFAVAVGLRPSVQAEQLRLKSSDKQVQIAKAQFYPTLSLSAGLGSNYYSSYQGLGFVDQMDRNFSQYVGLSLNIPIFDRFTARNQVRSAKISRQSQALRLRQTEQALYKEIQQAWNGAVAARAKYDASQLAATASQDAFELVKTKYENGKATVTEFNESRTQMLKSRSDAVQATYEYLFQTSLVDFYRSGTLTL